MTTLLEQFSLTLPLWVFLIAGLYVVIGTYGLVRLVAQRLQLSSSNTTRQGFLNKPLMQFAAVFAISASVVGVLYLDSSSRNIDLITEAEKQIKIQVDYEMIRAGQTSSEVVLKAIPTVDGKDWGDETQQFDIVWTVQKIGGSAQNYVEQGRSSTTPSEIKVTLQSGSYRVTALISDEDKTYSETVEIEI